MGDPISSLKTAYPLGSRQYLAEEHPLRHQDGPVQLLGGHRPGIVSQGEGAGGVGEKLHAEAPMKRLPRGGVAAHLGHVAADYHRIDIPLPEPRFQVRARKASRQILLDQKSVRAVRHLRVQHPFLAPFAKEGIIGHCRRMLHDNDRQTLCRRGVHGLTDFFKAPRRVSHRKLAGKVFVLYVNDQ